MHNSQKNCLESGTEKKGNRKYEIHIKKTEESMKRENKKWEKGSGEELAEVLPGLLKNNAARLQKAQVVENKPTLKCITVSYKTPKTKKIS